MRLSPVPGLSDPASIQLSRIQSALHPLGVAPSSPGWNHQELIGLLPENAPTAEAAVLVGLVPRAAGLQVVLTRRNDGLRNHAGQVSFPGGRIEVGDADAVAAAVRETVEEIGLHPAQISPLGYLDPLTTITGFRVLPVVAVLAEDYVAVPDPSEVAAVFEVSLQFLLTPNSLQSVELEFGGRLRRVYEFNRCAQAPEQRIWGATASMLLNLRDRLAGVQ